jgi:hypothetical protein
LSVKVIYFAAAHAGLARGDILTLRQEASPSSVASLCLMESFFSALSL